MNTSRPGRYSSVLQKKRWKQNRCQKAFIKANTFVQGDWHSKIDKSSTSPPRRHTGWQSSTSTTRKLNVSWK